jgi:hypothetical protein
MEGKLRPAAPAHSVELVTLQAILAAQGQQLATLTQTVSVVAQSVTMLANLTQRRSQREPDVQEKLPFATIMVAKRKGPCAGCTDSIVPGHSIAYVHEGCSFHQGCWERKKAKA